MKNIYYTLPNFHKAIKRNTPFMVCCALITKEFYFFTQKACINYAANDYKDLSLLETWLKDCGVKIEYVEHQTFKF